MGAVVCVCVILAGSGCYPERIVWSPDGQRALVATKDHLYLCDPNGKLTDLGTNAPACMAWLADSKRYVAAMQDKLTAWKDIEPLLSGEDKDRLLRLAEEMREEILKSQNVELDKLKSVQNKDSDDISAAKIYLRDRRPEGLAAKLGPAWKEFESASRDCAVICVYEISNAAASQPARVLAKSLNSVVSICVPSHGKAVAWSAARPKQQGIRAADLFVVPTDGKTEPRAVAALCSWYFDWSADGRRVVYQAVAGGANADDEPRPGAIQQRQVCAADGALLKEPGAVENLAGVLFGSMTRVRCAKDGRILFASTELELPIAVNDLPPKGNLFAVDPLRQATITRLLTRSAQAQAPDLMDFFSVSPDGKMVCIPGGDGGAAVVELATGNVETIVGKPKEGSPEQKLHTVPVWRATGELCLMVPPGHPLGSPKRAEIILWTAPGKARLLSKDWPDEVIKGLSE
jgi:hypothetical protein